MWSTCSQPDLGGDMGKILRVLDWLIMTINVSSASHKDCCLCKVTSHAVLHTDIMIVLQFMVSQIHALYIVSNKKINIKQCMVDQSSIHNCAAQPSSKLLLCCIGSKQIDWQDYTASNKEITLHSLSTVHSIIKKYIVEGNIIITNGRQENIILCRHQMCTTG